MTEVGGQGQPSWIKYELLGLLTAHCISQGVLQESPRRGFAGTPVGSTTSSSTTSSAKFMRWLRTDSAIPPAQRTNPLIRNNAEAMPAAVRA